MEDIGAIRLGYRCQSCAITWRRVRHHMFSTRWRIIAKIFLQQDAVVPMTHTRENLFSDCCGHIPHAPCPTSKLFLNVNYYMKAMKLTVEAIPIAHQMHSVTRSRRQGDALGVGEPSDDSTEHTVPLVSEVALELVLNKSSTHCTSNHAS